MEKSVYEADNGFGHRSLREIDRTESSSLKQMQSGFEMPKDGFHSLTPEMGKNTKKVLGNSGRLSELYEVDSYEEGDNQESSMYKNYSKSYSTIQIQNPILKTYFEICENLMSKNVPREVQCREKQRAKIQIFLETFLVKKSDGCSTLIISGKPGGGKTLLVSNILSKIQNQQWKYFDSVEGFKRENNVGVTIEVLQLNAMKFTNCTQFLLDTLAYIFEKVDEPFNADHHKNTVYILESFKTKLKEILLKSRFILLIDELDTLASHDRKDFDIIVDFLNISEHGFLKIGISNTMDLFSTYKGTKNYLNSKKLTFEPYNSEELETILTNRIKEKLPPSIPIDSLISKPVLSLVSKKIYKNDGGDIRAMLNISRCIFESKIKKLLELEEEKSKADGLEKFESNTVQLQSISKITVSDAMAILNDKYDKKTVEVVKSLSLSMQLTIFALYYSITSETETTDIRNFKKHLEECKKSLGMMSDFDLEEILESLSNYNLVKIDKKSTKQLYGKYNIISSYKKDELGTILFQIDRFKDYINIGEPEKNLN